MINAWQWEKSKAIAFPACKCKSRLNFRVRGQFEINILKVLLMNTTYFICILKKFNLSLRSFEKNQLGSGYLQKNTRTQWVDNWAHDTVRRYWSADSLPNFLTHGAPLRARAPLKTGHRSFAFRGAKCWNKLPKDMKEVADCRIFKKRLTNIFLKWLSSFYYL